MSGRAVCVLRSGDGVEGTVEFSSSGSATRVTGTISGLKPGNHGFHIHMWGDLSNGCASTGGHFNPHGKTHGGPTSEVRHAGDLGNIVADESGKAVVDITDKQIPLEGPQSIIGRAVVVHAGEDDLGQGNNDESLKTGNAGGRVACGVVAMAPQPASM
ncbi:Superoxide dismutase Cu-Zn [Hondaea fermentalgiana]|uniref:Superoxide dismutase [Cu-Zn] n=1 Tax=Hondaea fermentalgiana TaxID=2315210 RepID=A0A2R5GB85_9STRA|nr:Superoxide dismutase Cu-Zn [Hondaea fermentalgiana]|eukprot:GBG26968.1 Superoxide dismutase Cu-Zn [Hondaea fermentalgiana]